MTRAFSGIQPTGELHLGNYLGATRRWVAQQHDVESVYCVVDLHALTVPKDPAELRSKTVEMFAALIACGLDPDVCTLFVQSHVPEHVQLAWLMECTVSFGELRRMTQFKDKSDGADFVSAGLFTYPALQAADILLHDTDQVPVGDDQRQHVELTRDVAIRFNGRYGETFVVPEHVIPDVGARVMDLQEPTNKMSKSSDSPQGTVPLFEDPAAIAKRIKRAVTDNDGEVRYDPATKPGVSNLLEILGALGGEPPTAVADRYDMYGPLKSDTADAVLAEVQPIQARYAALLEDRSGVEELMAKGAAKAREVATATYDRARRAIGLA